MLEFYLWLAFKWLLAVFACYRLARIISIDTISEQTRGRVGKWAAGQPKYSFRWYAAEFIHCPMCTGVWLAAGLAWLIGAVDWKEFILFWLSIAGAQSLLESLS